MTKIWFDKWSIIGSLSLSLVHMVLHWLNWTVMMNYVAPTVWSSYTLGLYRKCLLAPNLNDYWLSENVFSRAEQAEGDNQCLSEWPCPIHTLPLSSCPHYPYLLGPGTSPWVCHFRKDFKSRLQEKLQNSLESPKLLSFFFFKWNSGFCIWIRRYTLQPLHSKGIRAHLHITPF